MDLSWVPVALTSIAAALAGSWALVQIIDRSGAFSRYEKWHKIRTNLVPDGDGFEHAQKQEHRALLEYVYVSGPWGRSATHTNIVCVIVIVPLLLFIPQITEVMRFDSFGEVVRSIFGMLILAFIPGLLLYFVREEITEKSSRLDEIERDLRTGTLREPLPTLAHVLFFVEPKPRRAADRESAPPQDGSGQAEG